MNRLMVFSVIYLTLASLSPVLGYYVLRLNVKGTINRLFFIISLCLTFWALGFSVVIVAPGEGAGVFWTRVAAVGYEIIYSVLLHFTLLLTYHHQILRKKWLYPLLYLPAALCLYVFVLSPGFAQEIYQLEYSARGWVRTTDPNAFDYLFNIYYISAVLGSLLLLRLWKRKDTRPEAAKQANILTVSFVLAFGLGTLTDVLNGQYFQLPIPQMAPALFLIPLSAIFYCIDKYHFMKPQDLHKTELILNDEHRIRVFKFASYGFILGGIALYAMECFWWKTSHNILTIISSVLLTACGGVLHYVQPNKKSTVYLEGFLIFASITVTPILAINMRHLTDVSLWGFPIILIICALVFNSDKVLLAAAIPMFISQIYLWGTLPQQSLSQDCRTYVGRMGILLFIVVTAYFVHYIYVGRLKENAAQARTQKLISDIITGFSLIKEENTAENISGLLMKLLNYFGAEKALLYAIDDKFSNLLGTQYYASEGKELLPEQRKLYQERWAAYYSENPDSPAASPHKYKYTAEQTATMQLEPWFFIPVYEEEKPIAFFYIESSREGKIWTRDQLIVLPIISRIVSDALAKLNSELRIRFMAYYDGLTKLPNRQLFQDRAEQAIYLARRNNKILGIIFLDLDFFKSINDTIGHYGGDQVIQEIGQKLAASLRKTDTVARFGGDEFLILLNNVADVEDIAKITDKILDIFQEPILLKNQEIFITASAGIAVFPGDGEEPETLIKHADIAMYIAKEKGKNQYAFCSANLKETVEYQGNLSNNLYKALARREFQVYYQPQVDLRTKKITGLEALLRWFHPTYGMILPSEFIALTEQIGLINSIGNWVLETACRQAVEWKRQGLGDFRMAVNLSVVQLRNPALVSQIEDILVKTEIDPAQVELEITESAMTKEPDYIIRVLNDLKSLGISISIDDFGTEYSSLSRLKLLPIDRLKMDMQFVHGIEKSEKDKAISKGIINLAKSLRLKVIAEGVETGGQLDFLSQRMCDEVQGYYYYKPMAVPEIEAVLRSRL